MSLARLAVWALVLLFAVNALSAQDFATVSKMLSLPAKIAIDAKGQLEFDKKSWTEEKQADGTELLTAKAKNDARIAVMRADNGAIETFTAYELKTKKESSISAAFSKDRMTAFTSCEEGGKNAPGRVCVTATPKLCQSLKAGEGLTPQILDEMDAFEMKALATILTLRGADHQLDNMVKTGNRLGLTSALQTTKGQLIAFARELAKEQGKRIPAAEKSIEKPADAKIEKDVLEESLPRLKKTCVDTGFTGG